MKQDANWNRGAVARVRLVGPFVASCLATLTFAWLARAPGHTQVGGFFTTEAAAAAAGLGTTDPTYATTFLDITSMWGMGADARTIPPRRRHVPLVRWNEEAVNRVRSAWRRLQWDSPCARAMYVYPHSWGITSQMRDYSDAAIVALAFLRPLRVVYDAKKPRWCERDAWLECFFKPLSSARCAQHKNGLARLAPFLPNTRSGSAKPEAENVFSSNDVLHMDVGAQFTFVLDDYRFFPRALWMSLVGDELVSAVDEHDAHIDMGALLARDPRLFHTLSLSALRTMLTSIIFEPLLDIEREVRFKQYKMAIVPEQCIALHLRWTDKRDDGGIARNLTQGSTSHLLPAIVRLITRRRGPWPQCLLLMTDDDRRALPLVRSTLGRGDLKIHVLSHVTSWFANHPDDYMLYAQIGHNYFQRLAEIGGEAESEIAFDFYRSTIVDVFVAANNAQSIIGVGSSGVSQLVAQIMGFKRRADANAFAIWQEDFI